MDQKLEGLKAEMERFGRENDAARDEVSRRMRNITRESAEFLAVLVRAVAASRILEIGTSNGYSTLWLAEAALADGGTVTTVELSGFKVRLAAETFARSGIGRGIIQLHEEAGAALARFADHSYDFIFLDTNRSAYPAWWPDVRRVLQPGGLLVADNATSHADEMADFIKLVKHDPLFSTCIVPVGKGEFMAVKSRESPLEPPVQPQQ